jgi:putative glutamine amidotransferase
VTRPLIAISSRPRRPGEVRGWASTEAAAIQYTYLEALWRAGCDEAVIAPRSDAWIDAWDVDAAKGLLARVDGLVLVGGGDVDPQRFGQERHGSVYDVEPGSDALEIALALAAIELGLPLLAICRGMQVVNVALGGTLHQHITDTPGFGAHGDRLAGVALHNVDVTPGSLLAASVGGARVVQDCWSYHHQVVDRLGDGLIVSGRSSDGAVEAMEFENANSWMLAVQWHPERQSDVNAQQQALFNALARAAVGS